MKIIPINLKLEGFSLIQDTKKLAEKTMIEKLIVENAKVQALPSTHRMRTCTVENETFGYIQL